MSRDQQDPTEGEGANTPGAQQEITLLKKAIGLGFDVEAFMSSDIGRYLQIRASRELEQAQDALVAADASDLHAIRELQVQARVAQRILTYLADALQEGTNAEERLHATFDAERTPN